MSNKNIECRIHVEVEAALRLALEALELVVLRQKEAAGKQIDAPEITRLWSALTDCIPTITAIKEALAQQEQEPDDLTIAYMSGYHDGKKAQPKEPQQEPACCIGNCPNKKECNDAMHCLYTTPPQRKPLTDEQIAPIIQQYHWLPTAFARAIEAAHGIYAPSERRSSDFKE